MIEARLSSHSSSEIDNIDNITGKYHWLCDKTVANPERSSYLDWWNISDLVLDNNGDDDIDEDDEEDGGDAHKAKYDDDGDDDQFGQIDASQQFGQPPLYSARAAS